VQSKKKSSACKNMIEEGRPALGCRGQAWCFIRVHALLARVRLIDEARWQPSLQVLLESVGSVRRCRLSALSVSAGGRREQTRTCSLDRSAVMVEMDKNVIEVRVIACLKPCKVGENERKKLWKTTRWSN
jgi:hypothetical protein